MDMNRYLLLFTCLAAAVFLSQGVYLNEDKEVTEVGDFIFFIEISKKRIFFLNLTFLLQVLYP